MPVYQSAEVLYHNLQTLFAEIERQRPETVASLLKAKMRIRLQCSDPEAEVSIDARVRPYHITYGANSEKPDLNITLSTDTLHQILLGELSLKKAIGRRQVVPHGPVHKVMALADLFRQAQMIYPDIVAQDD